MTHEELIEKLARQECIAAGENPDTPTPHNPNGDFLWHFYRAGAKRSIATIREALSEPDKDMLRAGLNWHEHVSVEERYPLSLGVWRAMLAVSPLVARENVDSGDKSP